MKNEEAFRNWCEKTNKRAKSGHYDYLEQIIRYDKYDYSTSPEPSYVNPKPWNC